MAVKKIYEIPEEKLTKDIINNCFFVEFEDQEKWINPLRRVKLTQVLDQLIEKAKNEGLEINLIKDNENEKLIIIK